MVCPTPAGQSAGMAHALASLLSLHNTGPGDGAVLCAALSLPEDGEAPEWVHLLPAGQILTGDGRGPYRVADASGLVTTSLQEGDRLPIDENHATDLAAPKGQPAPARGWIVELQARSDGVWGRVEWTDEGRRLVEGRAYRGISPVIQHMKNGEVTAILRASLVNRPNLRGLTALHSQTSRETPNMTLIEKLLEALGLDAGTTEDQLIARVTAMHAEADTGSTALQAAITPIARAIGLEEDADAAAVLAGVEALKAADKGAGDDTSAVTALQAELADVTTRLNTLSESTRREKAEAFVDAEIRRGRVGLKPVRDRYVTMHMSDPDGAQTLINAMPVLGAGGSIVPATPPAKDGEIALQAEQATVARMLGINPKDYAETLKAERSAQTAL